MNDPFANPDITRRLHGVRARDAFVIGAIVLITTALGFGAFLQFDVGVFPSLILSGLVFSSLVSTHLLVVRSQAVGALSAEVARLNAELANTRQLVAQGSARPIAQAGTREPPRMPPQPIARSAPPAMPAYPPAELPQAPPAAHYPDPYAAQDMHAAQQAAEAEPFGQIVAEFAAAQQRRPAPPPLPQNRPTGAAAPAPDPTLPTPAPAEAAQPVAPAAASARPAKAEPIATGAPSLDRVSRALAPRGTAPPATPRPAPAAPAAGDTPPLEDVLEAIRPTRTANAASGLETTDIPPAAESADGFAPKARDLEVMQRLIDQLSAQLNTPATATPPPETTQPEATVAPVRTRAKTPSPAADDATAAPPARSPSSTTEAETPQAPIAALKAAKDEMRAALQPGAAQDGPPDRRRTDRRQTEQPTPPAGQAERRRDTRRAATAPPKPPIAEQAAPPVPAAPPPTPAPAATKPAQSYSRLAEIAEAVASDRIALFLEPIAMLESRKPRHFEVSAKLRTGTDALIDADEYVPLSVDSGLLARIDAKKLAGAAQIAERLDRRGSKGTLFSGLSGESLADNMFLDVFADLFTADNTLSHRLVITFAQADVRAFGDAHWVVLSEMAEIGFRFSLEAVSDLDMDFAYLKSIGFDFVKLDASVFLVGMPIGQDTVPSADICRFLADLGLTLVVDAIDDERQLAKVMGFGVLFGQGTLFGGARLVEIEPATAAA